MSTHTVLRLLLPAALILLAPPPGAGADDGAALEYRTHAEVAVCLRDVRERAWGRGLPAEIVVYGKSRQGRDLLALRLGRATPVVLVHGGLGARDAAATVACLHLAERLVADKASTDALTWLLLPAPNPDALDAFLAGKPPTGGGAVDRDRDGRRGEDGPADLDDDGEILRIRRVCAGGVWATPVADDAHDGKVRTDPRLLEEMGGDTRRKISYEVFDEGLDDDGDGEVNEDPPALDLTRQLAGFQDDKAPWAGDGPFPGYAPEARALMELSYETSGLVAWYGFTGTGPWALRASGPGRAAGDDNDLYQQMGARVTARTGRRVKKARDVSGGDRNPGCDLDWARVHLGITAFRIPVWWIEKEERSGRKREVADELDWLLWNDRVLGGDGFVSWRDFEHPTLGPVEVGGWKRFTRYEPPSDMLTAAVEKVSAGPLAQVGFAARLGADVAVAALGSDLYRVEVRALNRGDGPTDTRTAERHRRGTAVRISLAPSAGVTVEAGPMTANVGGLGPGAASREAVVWLVRREGAGPLGRVRVVHPKADAFEKEVKTP